MPSRTPARHPKQSGESMMSILPATGAGAGPAGTVGNEGPAGAPMITASSP